MCIIVYKPKEESLKKEILEICHKHNKEGIGFMYAYKDKIHIHKELEDFDKIWKIYKKEIIKPKLETELNIVWHFRIQTHGDVDLKNCHPFAINNGDNLAFCHNGTITSKKAKRDSGKSDTLEFKDEILNFLPKNFLDNPGIVELLKKYVGKWNKLVFLNKSGSVWIMNQDEGHWDDKIWYSNKSYKEYETKTTYYSSKDDGQMRYWESKVWLSGYVWDHTRGSYVLPAWHSDADTRQRYYDSHPKGTEYGSPIYTLPAPKDEYKGNTLAEIIRKEEEEKLGKQKCTNCGFTLKKDIQEEMELGLCSYCINKDLLHRRGTAADVY